MTETSATDGLVRLSDWGVIRAEGADAARFLHAQLTQDIEHLGPAEARLAGWCSAKGRLLATFVVWRESTDTLLLACSADLLPATLKRLSMFVLRAKCKLSDASAQVTLYGAAGATATALAADALADEPWSAAIVGGARAVRLPSVQGAARILWAQDAAAPAPACPALDGRIWADLEVRSGVARIVAATADQFVPQMVNLELVGGVSFQKGCYPGQEVVARSQYRGTLKRRAALFATDAALVAGQEVFHDADPGQPAGMIVLAAAATDAACHALVQVKLAALEGGTLRAGVADGAVLRPLALPYVVPLQAD